MPWGRRAFVRWLIYIAPSILNFLHNQALVAEASLGAWASLPVERSEVEALPVVVSPPMELVRGLESIHCIPHAAYPRLPQYR